MPTFRKLPNGRVRVEVRHRNPDFYWSDNFAGMTAARIRGAEVEADYAAGKAGQAPNKLFSDLLIRFRDNECPKRPNGDQEADRINVILRDELVKVRLPDLDSPHIAAWRDRRLKSVKGSTVNREWALLSMACTVAQKEWRWLTRNPFSDVRKPPPGKKRDRLITPLEIEALGIAAGQPDSVNWRTYQCFLWALETGMRQGEIAALEPADIVGRVVKVRGEEHGAGKTDAASREVPLTETAQAIAADMIPRMFNEKLFGLTASQIQNGFRNLRDNSAGDGYTFHDARHNAATEWAKRLNGEGARAVLLLCRMFGWSNVKEALTYFDPKMSDVADDIANKL